MVIHSFVQINIIAKMKSYEICQHQLVVRTLFLDTTITLRDVYFASIILLSRSDKIMTFWFVFLTSYYVFGPVS